MIRFKKIKGKDITKDFLKDFERLQYTTKVKFFMDGTYQIGDNHFKDDWDTKKKERISLWFKKTVTEKKAVVIAAYDDAKLVGFTNIELPLFKGYINMPFIHVSNGYRGKKIGKELLYLIALEAKLLGAKKLYISSHPAIETQHFYTNAGCAFASYINEDILAHEPLDLQLELDLDIENLITRYVQHEISKYKTVTAVIAGKIASKLYKHLPKDDVAFLNLCRSFIKKHTRTHFALATLWMKRRKTVIDMKHMTFFESIVLEDIRGWGEVDQFCYRVMNPMIELEDSNYKYLDRWSNSDNKDVRRVSLVSMIRSSGKLTLGYDYDKMMVLVNRLKDDEDIHVKKAVGWVLKCAYVTYKNRVTKYLEDNVKTLDRLIFRYALEHANKEDKQRLMQLS